MPTFEWQEFFSVGHDGIDDQHKQLFEIANELYEGLKRNEASTRLQDDALDALVAHARRHFADEEALMQAAGYPDFERHKMAHAELLGKVEEFEARKRAGETSVAAELLPFLVGEWLSHHIAFEDQQYVGYIDRYKRRTSGETRAAAPL